jgi:hypothetical protein
MNDYTSTIGYLCIAAFDAVRRIDRMSSEPVLANWKMSELTEVWIERIEVPKQKAFAIGICFRISVSKF